MISEEMRILYVALTRAKEKLIITGTSKDWKKFCKEREEMLALYTSSRTEITSKKLQGRIIKKYASYLDWITLLVLNEPKQNKISLKVHKLAENSQLEEQIVENKLEKVEFKADKIDKIAKILEWEYPYQISSQIPSKTSVSKLKEQAQEKMLEENEIDLEELLEKKTVHNFQVPKFIVNEQEKVSNARKGTLVHLCLQKLDTKRDYSLEDLQELIQNLVEKKIVLEYEAKEIPIIDLQKYLRSNLWQELKQAKEIHKEEPFYLNLPASRINKGYPEQDKILVQGVMDLYFIDKNDKLVLVDYKTDYVKRGQEQQLIEKYEKQLNLYKEALEKALNRQVDKTMIYSTYLGEISI